MNEQHTAVPPYTPQSSTVTIIEHLLISSYIVVFYLTARSTISNSCIRMVEPFMTPLLPYE